MKAFVMTRYGAPFQEAELPRPTPGHGQVLVRMAAAGINHADDRARQGEFKALFKPSLPSVAGGELSGTVVEIGDGVSTVGIGDEVFAYTGVVRMGAFAEYAVVDAEALALAPRSVSLTEAASLPVVALTAWQALVTLGKVQPGHRVLVHGGSGGVGSVTIQLAKHLGATVATTVSGRNADFVRELGAGEVIDYRSQDFVAELAEAPVDLVLDTQGGETTSRSFAVLRPGGLVVGIAGTPDPGLADQAGAPLPVKLVLAALSSRLRAKAKKLGVTYRFLFIEPDGTALATIAGLVDQGVLQPVVDRVLPFERTLDAVEQMLAGGTRGKVLVATESDEQVPMAGQDEAQRPTTWATTTNSRVTIDGTKLLHRDLGPLGGIRWCC